jgi:ABC-type nitrate/sulfonate/bicarbonate transport system substrate-binding protein
MADERTAAAVRTGRWRLRLAASLAALSLVAAGCGSAARPAAGTAASSPAPAPSASVRSSSGGASSALAPVTVAVPVKAEPFMDFYVGRDLGIWAKHGLDLKIVVMKPPAALAAVTTGAVTFWGGAGSGAKAAETGRPVRIIFLGSDAPGVVMVGAKGVTNLKQVAGHTVAVKAPLDTTVVVTRALMKGAGVPSSAYHFDYAGTTGAQIALIQKGLAAAAILELGPALKLKAQGYPVIGSGLGVHTYGSGLLTSEQEIKDHPGVLRRAVAAYRDTLKLELSDKQKVLGVMEKEFNDSPALASQIYDLTRVSWVPGGVPPQSAVQGEIASDTAALVAAHVKLAHPLTESDFTDLQFVSGKG